jgi:hypothetical protein
MISMGGSKVNGDGDAISRRATRVTDRRRLNALFGLIQILHVDFDGPSESRQYHERSEHGHRDDCGHEWKTPEKPEHCACGHR